MAQKLYEYVVWKDEKRDKQTGDVIEKAAILVQPTVILASSDEQVGMVAAREVPAEHMEDDDSRSRVKIQMRPF